MEELAGVLHMRLPDVQIDDTDDDAADDIDEEDED